MKTPVEQAAHILLEHIVYYDLVERRGVAVADAIVEELVAIGIKSIIEGAAK